MKNKLNKLKNKLGVIVFNIMICFCMAENYVFAGIPTWKICSKYSTLIFNFENRN